MSPKIIKILDFHGWMWYNGTIKGEYPMTESRPDAYTIYCEWCVAHNRVPPTREWWDNACTEVPASDILSNEEVMKLLSDDQADIDTERREGWSYGE